MSGSAVTSHDWPKMRNTLSARQSISYLLSFQVYLSLLEAVRLQHRNHRNSLRPTKVTEIGCNIIAHYQPRIKERWSAIRTDWWATVLTTHFFRLSGCLPGSSGSFVALHRIRGFMRLEFREFIPATACVSFVPCISPCDPMYSTLSSTLCKCKFCQQCKPHQL